MQKQKKIGLFVLVAALGVFAREGVADASPRLAPAPAQSYSVQASRPEATESSRNLGLGLMFGEPTGLTLKNWLSGTTALQFGLTYSINNYLAVLADYLWHFPGVFKTTSVAVVPYAGIGAILAFSSDGQNHDFFGAHQPGSVGFGARIPLGVEILPAHAPLGIFAEIVPGVGLFPGIEGFVQGDVGVRFYL